MRATVAASQLRSAIDQVRPALRQPVVGLESFQLRVLKGSLVVSASGRALAVDVTLPAAGHEDGQQVVPARLLRETAVHLGDGMCTLESASGNLLVTSSALTASIREVEMDAWPILTPAPNAQSGELSGEDLRRLSVASRAASTDVGRPVLTGLHVGGGWAESTDSTWAIRTRLEVGLPPFVIPADVAIVLGSLEGITTLTVDDSTAEFRTESARVASPFIPSKFPSLALHFGARATSMVEVDRSELAEAIATAAVFDGSVVALETTDR